MVQVKNQQAREWNDNYSSYFTMDGFRLVLRERVPNSKRGFCFWAWEREVELPFDHNHYESWDAQMVACWRLTEGVNPPFSLEEVFSKASK